VTGVRGLCFKVAADPEKHPELKTRIEDDGRASFQSQFGCEPVHLAWFYEAASGWTDPETGEHFDLLEQWALMVEGPS
jgi:hypothetical protein